MDQKAGIKGAARQESVKTAESEELKFGKHYKWIALSNTTLGALMSSINGSILIISLPAIFRGLNINPLMPTSIVYLLWLLLGYNVVTGVILLTIGRLSDMYGRVRLYNLGFLIFTIGSIGLYISSLYIGGTSGALSLILLRLLQGLGGAFLFANSTAILTDAFPSKERGKAMGFNQIAAVGGGILGLIIGGLLSTVDWHLVFLLSVPIGIIGTIWAYLALHETGKLDPSKKLDLSGNIIFAASLTLILIALTYAILPYGSSPLGWSNPLILSLLGIGILLLAIFVFIELKSRFPMFNMALFKIRAFTFGNISLFLAGISRGGLQFMLIIWLQGIWLPLHGVPFSQTPFDAALDMIPFIVGFMFFGPLSGYLSDRYGARLLSTIGMLVNVAGFLVLATLPAEFNFVAFAAIIFFLGVGQGLFAAPNTTAIMNSLPAERRGSGSGMRATFMNVSFMFSLAIFFTLLISGFAISLPHSLYSGLVSANVPASTANSIASLPPTAAIFSAFLGYNPLKTLIPASVLSSLPSSTVSAITSKSFFPKIISSAFMSGMRLVFYLGALLSLVAAIASALRGPKYIHE
ncbi:MAG: MFS transporter [Candidatus Micrarchaeales archaeon]|jgi:MFS family permease|uniref:Major facilitator superfamily MFS_1 n=1 Tax=Candidatus Micrarchaeum acidiphilum ARMAN-2 TaxID=425595 RepID=C7DHL1_MICA2|nr:MAG: major facilitator superfamily MFS_1 [Candidatus Micrarchaeum acidiphilum ARMAN-2]MCW6160684.1 MFS transporter [Candidatus Micrarchaeales archaeon]